MRSHQAMASFQSRGFQTGNRPGGGEYRQRGVRHQNHIGHGLLTVMAWWLIHLPHPTCCWAPTGTCEIQPQRHSPDQQFLAPSVVTRATLTGSFQLEKPTDALNASVWHRLVFNNFGGARTRAAAGAPPNKPTALWVNPIVRRETSGSLGKAHAVDDAN